MTDFIARRDVLIGVAVISAWHGLCLQALAAKSEAQKLKMSVENSFAKISLAVDEALKTVRRIAHQLPVRRQSMGRKKSPRCRD
jgi:hypothetical protein